MDDHTITESSDHKTTDLGAESERRTKSVRKSKPNIVCSFFCQIFRALSGIFSASPRVIVAVLSYYLLFYCQLSIPDALRRLNYAPNQIAPLINGTIDIFESVLDALTPEQKNVTVNDTGLISDVATQLHNFAATTYDLDNIWQAAIPVIFFTGIYYGVSSIYYKMVVKSHSRREASMSEDVIPSSSPSKNVKKPKAPLTPYAASVNVGSLVTSSIHSFIVLALGFLFHTRLFVSESHVAVRDMFSDKLRGYSPLVSLQLGIARGYFIWDICISLWQYKIFGVGSLIHAITGLVGFTLLPAFRFGQYFISFGLLYELSTIPLNLMLYYRDINKNELFSRIAGLFFSILFIHIRILQGYSVQKDAQKTASDNYTELMTAETAKSVFEGNTYYSKFARYIASTKEEFHIKMRAILYFSYSGVNFFFWLLNVVWGIGIISTTIRNITKLFTASKTGKTKQE